MSCLIYAFKMFDIILAFLNDELVNFQCVCSMVGFPLWFAL